MKLRIALIVIALIIFFPTMSLVTTGLRPSTNNTISGLDSDTSRLGQPSMASNPDLSSGLTSQARSVALTTYATIYTNLTSTVFMVAVHNNSLLNSKNYLWIEAHYNLTDTPLDSSSLVDGSTSLQKVTSSQSD